jgi:hypothetical protein
VLSKSAQGDELEGADALRGRVVGQGAAGRGPDRGQCRGIDISYVVTSLQGSDAEHIYEMTYCARGQVENLIKQHKHNSHPIALPLAAGQPDAAHPAHRCLLAATRPVSCNPERHPLQHTEFVMPLWNPFSRHTED